MKITITDNNHKACHKKSHKACHKFQRKSLSKAHVTLVQKNAIYALLNYGLDSEHIHQVLIEAANTFSHVSVAGCKAAITKGYLLKT